MSEQQSLPISVQPVISYPREAQVGKTYLMTVDLRLAEGAEWLFEEEEYPVYCMVDSEPLFRCEAVGEAAIVLHRFGGSYGAAEFLISATRTEARGSIQVILINSQGVPVRSIRLRDISISSESLATKFNQHDSLMRRTVRASNDSSSIRILPSSGKTPTRPLLLVDPEMPIRLGENPENIQVYKDTTFASFNFSDWQTGKLDWNDVECKEPKDLFLPELTFIDHQSNAIPGSLSPINMPDLTLDEESITPLLPLNHLLLEHFTAEDLIHRVRFQVNGSESVQVSLDLPLSGVLGNTINYRVTKMYKLKKENALDGVPILEIWPHFRSAEWKEYYIFYYDAGLGKDTFQIELNKQEAHAFKDQNEIYRMWRLEQYPTAIYCQNETHQSIGIILLRQPEEFIPSGSWKVGVDFGTCYTNIYINRAGLIEPLPLENLLLKVTAGPLDTRFPVLLNYFLPEEFLPSEKPLPLHSVLTTRGGKQGGQRAILDGRIYVPNLKMFDSKTKWIKIDPKWSDFTYSQLFLKNVALLISAIAAKQGVNHICWVISYSSAFSQIEYLSYAKAWSTITQDLESVTGIRHEYSGKPGSEHFRTESLAVAQYFAGHEFRDLLCSTCVDIGNRTSDISIWENNRLIHQCSVQMAGRDLLSNFLEINPRFIAPLSGMNVRDWKGLRDNDFRLNTWLRWESENWLKSQRTSLLHTKDVQGLTQLMAIGFAGLYYYVGILLQVLNEEGKYTKKSITDVYLGGNGSRLMHWLDPSGMFTERSEINILLSRMLAISSGFEDTKTLTYLTLYPKDEVAIGLVLEASHLQWLSSKNKDPMIAGEDYELNDVLLDWNQRLDIEGDVMSFRIPTFPILAQFLHGFHDALDSMQIGGIVPISGFTRSSQLADNLDIWEGTRRELVQLLQSQTLLGDPSHIRIEPPFILGLKALLRYLGREWAEQ
jgi:hypothetical protein